MVGGGVLLMRETVVVAVAVAVRNGGGGLVVGLGTGAGETVAVVGIDKFNCSNSHFSSDNGEASDVSNKTCDKTANTIHAAGSEFFGNPVCVMDNPFLVFLAQHE